MGLEKSDFWVFENFSFYTKRNVSFLSRPLLKLIYSPILTEKRYRKYCIFNQKHGLTPLEKCDFGDFKKGFFVKKGFFFPFKVIKHYF